MQTNYAMFNLSKFTEKKYSKINTKLIIPIYLVNILSVPVFRKSQRHRLYDVKARPQMMFTIVQL